LAVDVYKAPVNIPTEERYGLTSQMKICAVSVPSNIAEGASQNTNGEFRQFLSIANGSIYELEIQLILSNRLKLIDDLFVEPLLKEIGENQKNELQTPGK